MINEAHKQISDNNFLPVELQRINEILADYNTDYAKKWRKAITQLYFSDDYKDKRYDLVSYVHGQSPKRNNTWIDADKPHKNYTAGRNLESVEVHIPEVEDLIIELYR